MIDQVVTIDANRKINKKYYKLIFRSKSLSRNVLPGQFMNIQIEPGFDPFLRRPFSYYRVAKESIEVLYEVFGRGTASLAKKRKGDPIKVLGPLGKPFTHKLPRKNMKRILIGGGVGVPPLVFLAECMPTDYLLIGTKSRSEVMPKKELSQVKAEILFSTNDGSYGKKGFVTALLEQVLKTESAENIYLQTCGPEVMMKAVYDIARRKKIAGEASMEKIMACGVGVCLGCMVKTDEGWVPSCTQGPVFEFKEIHKATWAA